MSENDVDDSEKVMEDDVVIQTPNGERYPATVIDLTGKHPTDDE